MMYREKLMPGACASPLDKFDAIQMYFASGSAEKKAVVEELSDKKIAKPVFSVCGPVRKLARYARRDASEAEFDRMLAFHPAGD